jgi:hypothetical protein
MAVPSKKEYLDIQYEGYFVKISTPCEVFQCEPHDSQHPFQRIKRAIQGESVIQQYQILRCCKPLRSLKTGYKAKSH